MNAIKENLIIKQLLTNKLYFNKVFPFLSEELFESPVIKKAFCNIRQYISEYDSSEISPTVLEILSTSTGLSESENSELLNLINFCKQKEDCDSSFLINQTLEFIKQRKYFLTLVESANKFDNLELDISLPSKLESIYSINFDTRPGLELNDLETKWNTYTNVEDRLPFLITRLNQITKGRDHKKDIKLFTFCNNWWFQDWGNV